MSEGRDTAKAIRHLTAAGLTIKAIAGDLRVTVRTVRRWAAGGQPTARNLANLQGLVGDEIERPTRPGDVAAKNRRAAHLDAALDALTSDRTRAELARMADAIRASLHAPPAVTLLVDPFVICRPRGGLDALFPISA